MSTNNEPRVVVYCQNSPWGRDSASCDTQEEVVLAGLAEKYVDTSNAIVIKDRAAVAPELDLPGFNRLHMMIARREVDILAVDHLRRLGDTDQTVALISNFVDAGGRFIAVGDEIDSTEPGWKLMCQIHASWRTMMNHGTGQRIRWAQQNRLLADESVGDVCFGFESFRIEPASGGDGLVRPSRPRLGVRIHPGEAPWVGRIFAWFVGEGLPMQRIAERLTELSVPKPRGSKSRIWHARDIRRILTCSKYVGQWVWGRTTTVVDHRNGKRRRVPVSEDQQISVARPHLRIIDQATWDKAQEKLARLREIHGRQDHGPSSQHREIDQGRSPGNLNRSPWREPLRFPIVGEVLGWDGNPIRVSLTQYIGLDKWKAYDEKGKETIVDGGLVRLLPPRALIGPGPASQLTRRFAYELQGRSHSIAELSPCGEQAYRELQSP